IDSKPDPTAHEPMMVALFTLKIARRLGVQHPVPWHSEILPYADSNDNTVFDAPLTSFATSARIRFMRGWKYYQSCVKGFNALGLIADLVLHDLRALQALDAKGKVAVAKAFLESRQTKAGAAVFTAAEVNALSDETLLGLSELDLAIWRVCAKRTVVCSTSSNMGISLHEVLRYMQQAEVSVGGKTCTILNLNEGSLIIWCPDEEADFMNPEKTEALRALEREEPKLTVLHTYINRRQRDPGALKDAVTLGGYFFPTNPQSKEELQNLLANALKTLAEERKCREEDLLTDETIRLVLTSMGCVIDKQHIVVRRGVEGGLHGLMVAYLLMMEETLPLGDIIATSTWNQASIGAALAAAVLADLCLRDFANMSAPVKDELKALLPQTYMWLGRHKLGQDIKTRVHGIFDIANLQSLAQLLGVVVENHLSGRGTAYVGLGSSSYANGNSCYDILKRSETLGGPFHGKTTFHPATHAVNPLAQALVVADDLYRIVSSREFAGKSASAQIALLKERIHKPEPAGAAALAGYLLSRLDTGTLSISEMAYALKLAGFTANTFLELAGYKGDDEGASWYLQEASEEGPHMAGMAQALLECLGMDLDELAAAAKDERIESQKAYEASPLDPPDFETLEPVVNIYLTGDNTRQPSEELLAALLKGMNANKARLQQDIQQTDNHASLASPKYPHPRAIGQGRHVDLVEHIQGIFERNAARTFLVDATAKKEWTYRAVFEQAIRAAQMMRGQGVAHGDRVALSLPNGPVLAASYFGCMMIGAVAVPINPVLTAPEFASILKMAKPKLIVLAQGMSEKVSDAGKAKVVTAALEGAAKQAAAKDAWNPAEPVAGAAVEPFRGVKPDDVCLILFTSGTTSLPKGMAHTFASLFGNASAFNAIMGFDQDSRFYHIWPMTYSSGVLNVLMSPFMAEGSVVVGKPYDAQTGLTFWLAAMEHKANTIWLSPTMMASLMAIDRDARGPSYCREFVRSVCCGTAPLPVQMKQDFEAKYGVEVFESFGLTELLLVTANSPRYARRPGAVGQPLPAVRVKLARPDNDMEPDMGAEILVSTPYAMAGYVDSETGKVTPLEPGTFFPTGDIGRVDAEGNLYISGRKKDLIIRGGLMVSPAAVREVLLNHPAVADAVVVGVPHAFYGEEVGAALLLKDGQSLDAVRASILDLCRTRLQQAFVPSRMIALDAIPRSATGKVIVREIKEKFGA
ncbi:MAG: acyl--CoA ligase, partial [Rhodospirillaceae bacterium]|nr:acyl--CoA ligase [Rhodospirillaceae bacterium]